MVRVRVQREAVDVLGESPDRVGITRQENEVAVQDDGSARVRVQRFAIEVLGQAVPRAGITRQENEVAVQDDGSARVRVQRLAVEALTGNNPKIGITRQENEVAVQDDGSARVLVQRLAIEVLTRRGVPTPTPLPYPTGLDLFMQNWASEVELETAYTTDITAARTSRSEERRALIQRPARLAQFRWTRNGKTELDRLMVTLRRFTSRRLVLPLYQDYALVTADATSGQPVVFGKFANKRFFNGARVLIVPEAPTYHPSGTVLVHTISQVFPTFVVLGENLTVDLQALKFVVLPVIDVELLLDPTMRLETDQCGDVTATVAEVRGKSALPPTSTGNPDGWQVQLGLPVFEIEPDWSNGVNTTYRRYGDVFKQGRADVTETQGARYVQLQEHVLIVDRADFWRVLQFFDSRRGRTNPFFEVDREHVWTVVSTTTSFIDVDPFGDFTDFTDAFDFAGIVMKDGTVHIRQVTNIQQISGVWRLTLAAPNLPTIDVAQIDRFARARKKRFDSDAMRERWVTDEWCRLDLRSVELLAEKDIDLE